VARENSIKLNISPFGLVLLVTLTSLILSVLSGNSKEYSLLERIVTSLQYWRLGFFGLLDFTLQMMMVLVFG
jgi:short-chain fatty acids transporter